MSETNPETSRPNDAAAPHDDDAERREIGAVQDELDAHKDGDGLAAEAGSGEEAGLSEG